MLWIYVIILNCVALFLFRTYNRFDVKKHGFLHVLKQFTDIMRQGISCNYVVVQYLNMLVDACGTVTGLGRTVGTMQERLVVVRKERNKTTQNTRR